MEFPQLILLGQQWHTCDVIYFLTLKTVLR